MADFSKTQKTFEVATYPVIAKETSGLMRRVEPMLTPEQLISRYLKGIPLTFPNGDSFSSEDLKDKIYLAANEVELLVGTTINREAFKEKQVFDANLYRSFIQMKMEHGPILSIEKLSITASNGQTIFEIPATWIDPGMFHRNQINVVPLLAAFGTTTVEGSPISVTNQGAGLAFLAIWATNGGSTNVPGYWQIEYTAGLSNTEGKIPTIVNELIGTVAALDILSLIAPLMFPYTSQSQSQDGISQSSSGPGPRIFQLRIDELNKKRDELIRKIKGVFARKYFISNI